MTDSIGARRPSGSDPLERRLLFLHLPKTAGLSLYRAVAKALGEDRCARFGDEERMAEFRGLAPEALDGYRFVTGHLKALEFYEKGLGHVPAVMTVRDPIERAFSLYYYHRGEPNHPRHEYLMGLTLDEFLRTEAPSAQGCCYLCESPSCQRAVEVAEEWGILVAPVERFSDLVSAVSGYFGIDIPVLEENRARGRPKRYEPTEEQRAFMAPRVAEDTKLHEWALATFDRQLERFKKRHPPLHDRGRQ